MLKLFIPLAFLFSMSANANLQSDINDCYDLSSDTREGSKCADSEIVKEIRRLRRRVQQLENNSGGGNSPNDYSVIYSCNNGNDPVLTKSIVANDGIVLREDPIQTFTAGGDDQEKADCQQAILDGQNSLGSNMSSLCACDNGNDPILRIELINGSFKTVRTLIINTFTIGDDDQEKRDCQAFKADLNICQ